MPARPHLGGVMAATLLVGAGCAQMSPSVRECIEPDRRLAAALGTIRPDPDAEAALCPVDAGPRSCEMVRTRVNELVTICPRHAPTVITAAALAYDAGELNLAQLYLDDVLSWNRTRPEAAVLRIRVAQQDGNVRLARRLAEEQIRLHPSHAGLREALASVFYLQRQYPETREALEIALRLGAPPWRVSYNLGLVEEAAGKTELAMLRYTEALDRHPGFTAARNRLDALRAAAPPRRP